nr:lipopeptide WS1279 [validated] - Streptomyces willmorei [Streptomyces microflavus]
CNSGGS